MVPSPTVPLEGGAAEVVAIPTSLDVVENEMKIVEEFIAASIAVLSSPQIRPRNARGLKYGTEVVNIEESG